MTDKKYTRRDFLRLIIPFGLGVASIIACGGDDEAKSKRYRKRREKKQKRDGTDWLDIPPKPDKDKGDYSED
jgi:hypothetical protein